MIIDSESGPIEVDDARVIADSIKLLRQVGSGQPIEIDGDFPHVSAMLIMIVKSFCWVVNAERQSIVDELAEKMISSLPPDAFEIHV